ncbi:hypothetical protein Dsin_016942 [Dipteronia sinensis]|uniref:RNase H type-1 domain-containing protein n=1 Tax=Dipteronia sinensis TaxID=43782 RepID=A0AAE0AEN2_9ROSI|nr:hypothetical protein Dsin_016942 [Dipteronia sinensis]
MCPFMKAIKAHNGLQYWDFILVCMDQLRTHELELLCVVVWSLWYQRNVLVHNSISLLADDEVPWAEFFLEDFRKANVESSGIMGSQLLELVWWQPPCMGRFKANIDAVIDFRSGWVGVGVIIGDSKGCFLGFSAQVVTTGYSSMIAEALAVLRGLRFALEAGMWPCSFNFINSNVIPFSEVGVLIRDSRVILEDFSACSIDFVPRNANMAAHCLAKLGLSS